MTCWIDSRRIILAAVLALALLAPGCEPPARTSASHGRITTGEKYGDELFDSAIDNLNRAERFDLTEVQQQIALLAKSVGEHHESSDPLQATWPEPETLRQAVNRLNQWAQSQPVSDDWKPDPLLESLPSALSESPIVRNLGAKEFSYYDGFALLEAVWLRDLSNWAGGKREGIARAKRLFDWTVRNIQLETNSTERPPQFPWEVLLLGRGTAWERAWVFVLLCRQQKMDAAVLAVPVEGNPRPWCVAVNVEGELYLFDPALGLPLPGPQGVRLDEGGTLDVRPATLKQILAEPALLARLDFDADRPYWARQADLKKIIVLVEASPLYLSKRGRILETRLAGARSMVLSNSATAQAQRLKTAAGAAEARLWHLPFETLRRRSQATRSEVWRQVTALLPFFINPTAPLYKGRSLQLKGLWKGDEGSEKGAIEYFQVCRPTNDELQKAPIAEADRLFYTLAKIHASYWLGLIAFEQGHFDTAMDYFTKRTLDAMPAGVWNSAMEQSLAPDYDSIRAGAHYNLARTYEALGQRDQAVSEFQAGALAGPYYGNLLRARWLRELTPNADSVPKTK